MQILDFTTFNQVAAAGLKRLTIYIFIFRAQPTPFSFFSPALLRLTSIVEIRKRQNKLNHLNLTRAHPIEFKCDLR